MSPRPSDYEFMSPEMKAQIDANNAPENTANTTPDSGASTPETPTVNSVDQQPQPSNQESRLDHKKAVERMFKFVVPETESKFEKLAGASKELAIELFEKIRSKISIPDRAKIWYSSKLAEYQNSRLERVLSKKNELDDQSTTIKNDSQRFAEKMQNARELLGNLSSSAMEAEKKEQTIFDKDLASLAAEAAKVERNADAIRRKKEVYENSRDALVQKGVDRIAEQIRPIESRVQSFESKIELVDAKLEQFRTGLEATKAKLDLAESSLDNAEFKAERIAFKEALKKYKAEIKKDEKELNRLEDQRNLLMDKLRVETAKRDKMQAKSDRLAELGKLKTEPITTETAQVTVSEQQAASEPVVDEISEPKRLITKSDRGMLDEPIRLWHSGVKVPESKASKQSETPEKQEKVEAQVYSIDMLVDHWNKSKDLGLRLDLKQLHKIGKEKFPFVDLSDPAEGEFENIVVEYWRSIVTRKFKYKDVRTYANEKQLVNGVRNFFKEINE
ncbi:MAG: hypothetical protein JWO40_392 [Candidatus Doudnabacteria bacterium]|nr:hypothetical protein [Candidatus Doudnabacteria bacterium]